MMQGNNKQGTNQNPFSWKNLTKSYFVKTPWWLKKIYPSYIWDIKTDEKVIYLTFDDGPHEEATSFVLDELKKYNAKASFFCLGKNVVALPAVYNRILEEGHTVGNHTFHHLNGWNTPDKAYLEDAAEAARHIDSSLFRPPYGRIRLFQAKHIATALKDPAVKIVMWDVLCGDFDERISSQQCLQNIVLNVRRGSIVVFHDSEKAFPHLKYSLPRAMEFLAGEGFRFEKLSPPGIMERTKEKAG